MDEENGKFDQQAFEKDILVDGTNPNSVIESFCENFKRNGVFYISNPELNFEAKLKQKIKEYNKENKESDDKNETITLDLEKAKKVIDSLSYEEYPELKSLRFICTAFKNQKNRSNYTNIRRKAIYEILQKKTGAFLLDKEFLHNAEKISIVKISKLSQFSDELSVLMKNHHNLYFRGQANLNWKIQPGIVRNNPHLESTYFNEILRRYPDEFEKETTYCEKLARMQHFGIPTRLLDITENPYIALFFACESKFEDYGEVRIYTANRQDIKNYNDRDIHKTIKNILIGKIPKTKNCILLGKYSNRRIQNQKGLFIFCSGISENSSVEDMEYKDKEDKNIIFVISNKEKKKILYELELLGITEEFVYPDIENSAAYLKNILKETHKDSSKP